MRERSIWFVIGLLFLALLGSCGDPAPRGASTTPVVQSTLTDKSADDLAKDREALALISAMETRFAALGALPPAERLRAEQGLEPDLIRLAERTAGSKHENKAVYWLANWRVAYAGGRDADQALDRLDKLPSPAFKSAGGNLRVQALLRTGRVAEARRQAPALVEKVPEFQPLLNLVALYERIGTKPPRTACANLSGGVADPARERTEPWLLYVFTDTLDAETAFQVQRYLDDVVALGAQARLVCVATDGNPLNATTRFNTLHGVERADLLWANPNDLTDPDDWHTAWLLPPGLCTVLLGPGPERRIMGVQVAPEDLRALAGKR